MDPVTLLIIIGAAAGAWFFFRSSQYRTREPGAVARELSKLDKEFTVLSGVVLQQPEGMVRLDHVVLSPYGIYVILEVRETGRLECRMNEMEWPHKANVPMHNPVWRNRKQVNALESKLGDMRLFGIVVIVNARLVGTPGPEVVLFDGLLKKLRSSRLKLLEPEQISRAVEILTSK